MTGWGAFAYSEEEGTFAAKEYEDSISHEVKQQRLDELMALQQEIAGELSQTKIGKGIQSHYRPEGRRLLHRQNPV